MTAEGTVLDGKYEIWKEVGRGGMSIVYLARDNRLNKQWAVKEIKNDGSKSTRTLLKSLEREANILKNVDHPVLPRIVDIINQEGTIYVVMDFIEGETLSQRLKKEGAQAQELVVEWGIQLASALNYLHNMNPPVIYRDMKPSNVMIKPEGGVKLIDFGTAKEYNVENNADTTALGTRGYAAPEQFGDAQGHGIYNTDARTDIYNLGATLYHMITGKNPSEPPYEIKPIREWDQTLSSGLEKILLKCTQADPNDRYQTCSELLYALEHYNEYDDEYRKKNRNKLISFVATVSLTLVSGVISLVGYSGLQRIKMDNYNTYIEKGNEYRLEEDYASAAEEYKKAFQLDGTDAEAYEKYIQVYIEATNDLDSDSGLHLETGLNVVANRIKAGYGNVDKNDSVLFKMAITYFDELEDYKAASKYFSMIDSDDSEYGELAQYYESVSMILSSTSADYEELMTEINEFAKYNQTSYTNQNINKFINYKTIGRIYTTYIARPGVAEDAVVILNQAVEDLEEYTENEMTAEEINDLFYTYYDYLTVTYEALAKNSEDKNIKEQYYANVISYCEEYLNILDIKIEASGNIGIGANNDNVYNTAYYNKMSLKAHCYEQMGKYKEVIAVYDEVEQKLGKNNVLSNKVYAEHLDFIYTYCERKQQDPTKWKKILSNEYQDIINTYEQGKNVKNIETNKTWKKRKNTLEMLKEAQYLEEDNKKENTDDQNHNEKEE